LHSSIDKYTRWLIVSITQHASSVEKLSANKINQQRRILLFVDGIGGVEHASVPFGVLGRELANDSQCGAVDQTGVTVHTLQNDWDIRKCSIQRIFGGKLTKQKPQIRQQKMPSATGPYQKQK
jgi:hypothetical protein